MQRQSDLQAVIKAAWQGAFPVADGGWELVPTWRPDIEAVVAFTGHAYLALAADRNPAELSQLPIDGLGGAHHPVIVTSLAGPAGWIDSLDVLMVAEAGPRTSEPLVERPDLGDHGRARYAAGLRLETVTFGYPNSERTALVSVGRGIAGLLEIGFELEPAERGRGAGQRLIESALAVLPAGELVVAAVAPGNAASLRALLASSFRPLGSVQLFRRDGWPWTRRHAAHESSPRRPQDS